MAAHRKPKQRSLSGHTARTAATIAFAGAATATALDGTGHADPRLGPAEVKSKVDALYREAEIATEKYNGAKEKADSAEKSLGELRDEAARKTEKLNSAREGLGSIAAEQYRSGGIDPSVQLALSSDPDQYLERAALADRADSRQAATVSAVQKQLQEIDQLRTEADDTLAHLKSRQAELKKHKKTVNGKLDAAKRLLSQLTDDQRADLSGEAHRTGRPATRAAMPRRTPRPPTPAPQRPSRTPTRRSAAPMYGAPPAPTPSTAPGSPRPPTGRPGSTCRARRTRRSPRASGSRAPNSSPATWSSSTRASATSASTWATAR